MLCHAAAQRGASASSPQLPAGEQRYCVSPVQGNCNGRLEAHSVQIKNRNRNTGAAAGLVDSVTDECNVILLYGFISQYEVDSSNINRHERQSVKEKIS